MSSDISNQFQKLMAVECGYVPDHIEKLLKLGRRGDLIDIGCGVGHVAAEAFAQGWNATGLDHDKEHFSSIYHNAHLAGEVRMIGEADKSYERVKELTGRLTVYISGFLEAEKLTSYDVAICHNVLPFVPKGDWWAWFKKAHSIIKDEDGLLLGNFYVIDPKSKHPTTKKLKSFGVTAFKSVKEGTDYITARGFKVLSVIEDDIFISGAEGKSIDFAAQKVCPG